MDEMTKPPIIGAAQTRAKSTAATPRANIFSSAPKATIETALIVQRKPITA